MQGCSHEWDKHKHKEIRRRSVSSGNCKLFPRISADTISDYFSCACAYACVVPVHMYDATTQAQAQAQEEGKISFVLHLRLHRPSSHVCFLALMLVSLRRCVVASYMWTSLKVLLFSWPCEVIRNLRITNRGCLAVFYEIVMVCNLMMQYTGMITYYACTNKSNHLQSGTKVLRKLLKTGLLLANWLFV